MSTLTSTVPTTQVQTAAPSPAPQVSQNMPVTQAPVAAVTDVQTPNLVQQNSFSGAVMQIGNAQIHLLLAEIINFRKQLTARPEFKSQSGWNDSLNAYMLSALQQIQGTLNDATYKPNPTTIVGNASAANNPPASGQGQTQPNTITPENVVLPSSYQGNVRWDLSGNHADIPQVTPTTMPNDFARMFITMLDQLFVQLTRLDSRHQAFSITQYEGAMMNAIINQLFSLLKSYGGSQAQIATPNGVLPSMESSTFQSGNSSAVAVSQSS